MELTSSFNPGQARLTSNYINNGALSKTTVCKIVTAVCLATNSQS